MPRAPEASSLRRRARADATEKRPETRWNRSGGFRICSPIWLCPSPQPAPKMNWTRSSSRGPRRPHRDAVDAEGHDRRPLAAKKPNQCVCLSQWKSGTQSGPSRKNPHNRALIKDGPDRRACCRSWFLHPSVAPFGPQSSA